MDPSFTLREATTEDIPLLVRHRRLMFESMGFADQARNDAMDVEVATYLTEAVPSGEYRAWIATTPEGVTVGGIGLILIQLAPSPRNLRGRYAYLMSLYVEPEYRRKGMARALVERTIAWAREQGIVEVRLHASDQGRPLYEGIGFRQTNEMRMMLGD